MSMPRELPTHPVQFVFAPGLYPKTPLEGKPVFVHGTIMDAKQRNGEWDGEVGLWYDRDSQQYLAGSNHKPMDFLAVLFGCVFAYSTQETYLLIAQALFTNEHSYVV